METGVLIRATEVKPYTKEAITCSGCGFETLADGNLFVPGIGERGLGHIRASLERLAPKPLKVEDFACDWDTRAHWRWVNGGSTIAINRPTTKFFITSVEGHPNAHQEFYPKTFDSFQEALDAVNAKYFS